jgi:hypothetical protein
MNRELEALILAYERVSSTKDKEAENYRVVFDSLIDKVMESGNGP